MRARSDLDYRKSKVVNIKNSKKFSARADRIFALNLDQQFYFFTSSEEDPDQGLAVSPGNFGIVCIPELIPGLKAVG